MEESSLHGARIAQALRAYLCGYRYIQATRYRLKKKDYSVFPSINTIE